jgi:hypothetical protein
VDIGEEGDGFCPHHVDVAERRPGDVEPGEEGEVGEAGVHPVDGGDDVVSSGTDGARIIHLVDTDRGRRPADDPGELPVSEEVARSPRSDTELTHRRAGRLERKEVAGEAGRVLRLGKDRPGERPGIGGADAVVLDRKDIPGKKVHDIVVRSAGSKVPAADLFYIHCKSDRCRER